MALVTTSRTKSIPMTKRHLRHLSNEFLLPSIFFREPIHIEMPELDFSVDIGFGLGGLSWSLFHRGEGCTGCGRCCSNLPMYLWLYHPLDPQPSGLPRVDLTVNGLTIPYSYHIEDPGDYAKTDCAYLDNLIVDGKQVYEVNGLPIRICVLHGTEDPIPQTVDQDRDRIYTGDLKPMHCQLEPMTRAVRRRYGPDRRNMIVWERTLPSRNWAWPKCPVQVYKTPATEHVFRGQRRILAALERNYKDVPGNVFADALALWDELVEQTLAGSPPMATTILKDRI